jgi:hypothetical protein
MTDDEFRVEVVLSEEEHSLSLGDRLHSLDLDDEARERLGSQAIVSRDGSRLFIYGGTIETARESRRVVEGLLAEDGLEAEITTDRWHPIEGAWKDAEQPLPESEEQKAAELRAKSERVAGQDPGIKYPAFVQLQSYEPSFLRDLGL